MATMLVGLEQGPNPSPGRKKQRAMLIDHEHVLKTRLNIIHWKLFGCAPDIALTIWNLIHSAESKLPANATVNQLLWTLMFLKIYSKEATISGMAGGVDENLL
jgi:hypothetical protein